MYYVSSYLFYGRGAFEVQKETKLRAHAVAQIHICTEYSLALYDDCWLQSRFSGTNLYSRTTYFTLFF